MCSTCTAGNFGTTNFDLDTGHISVAPSSVHIQHNGKRSSTSQEHPGFLQKQVLTLDQTKNPSCQDSNLYSTCLPLGMFQAARKNSLKVSEYDY